MKFVKIALFMFLLQCSFAIVNATGLFQPQVQPQNEWISDVNQNNLQNTSYSQSQATSSTTVDFGFGDFVKGLFYFVLGLAKAVISVPYTLGQLGLRNPFTYYLSAPVYLLYLFGFAQWVANRNTQGME